MARIMDDISQWSTERKRAFLEQVYEDRMGVRLNLDNPERFTEKIQWRKLYDKNPVYPRLVDKLQFKEYVKEKIGDGYTTKLINVWNSSDEVDFSSIPLEGCVIKSNCSSDGKNIFIQREGNTVSRDLIDTIKKSWFDRLMLNTNSFFWPYYEISPCVMIEECISKRETGVDEYKFFCFDGEPLFVYHSDNHFQNGKNTECSVSFYSMEWNYLDIQYGDHPNNKNVLKTKFFDEMVEVARVLSKGFSFVRVDFFDNYDKFYVAELSLVPGAGWVIFTPESFDYELGSFWKIPTNKDN